MKHRGRTVAILQQEGSFRLDFAGRLRIVFLKHFSIPVSNLSKHIKFTSDQLWRYIGQDRFLWRMFRCVWKHSLSLRWSQCKKPDQCLLTVWARSQTNRSGVSLFWVFFSNRCIFERFRTRKGTLPFNNYLGACTVAGGEVLICFDIDNGKTCYKSRNPLGWFDKLEDSHFSHKGTGMIASSKSEFSLKFKNLKVFS